MFYTLFIKYVQNVYNSFKKMFRLLLTLNALTNALKMAIINSQYMDYKSSPNIHRLFVDSKVTT